MIWSYTIDQAAYHSSSNGDVLAVLHTHAFLGRRFDIKDFHVDDQMLSGQWMVEVDRGHGTRQFRHDERNTLFRRENGAWLGVRWQPFTADDAFFRLVIRAERIVRRKIDPLFLAFLHACNGFLEIGQEFVVAGRELADIFRDNQLGFRHRNGELHQHDHSFLHNSVVCRPDIQHQGRREHSDEGRYGHPHFWSRHNGLLPPLRGMCPTSVWCDPPGIARFAVILLTPFLPRRPLRYLLSRVALTPLTILFRP